jgi:hypothetical protein
MAREMEPRYTHLNNHGSSVITQHGISPQNSRNFVTIEQARDGRDKLLADSLSTSSEGQGGSHDNRSATPEENQPNSRANIYVGRQLLVWSRGGVL